MPSSSVLPQLANLLTTYSLMATFIYPCPGGYLWSVHTFYIYMADTDCTKRLTLCFTLLTGTSATVCIRDIPRVRTVRVMLFWPHWWGHLNLWTKKDTNIFYMSTSIYNKIFPYVISVTTLQAMCTIPIHTYMLQTPPDLFTSSSASTAVTCIFFKRWLTVGWTLKVFYSHPY